MAVASYAASVQGVALRVTRLDQTGRPIVGPENVYVTRAFMRVSFTPEYEEGDEVTEKNAAGEVCVTYKANDTLKRATMELAICDPDPELTELLTGGVLLKYGPEGYPPADETGAVAAPGWPTGVAYPNATVGYASVKVGESPNPNGVGVEVWSLAIKDGARDNDLPYYRWVFPKATLRPSGDRVIENGLLANTFEGWSVGNINFGTGPADDWYWPDATDRPFLYARDYTQPWVDVNGWYDYINPPLGPVVSNPGAAPIDPATGLDDDEYGVDKETITPPYTAPDETPYYHYEAENPPDIAVQSAGVQSGGPGTQGRVRPPAASAQTTPPPAPVAPPAPPAPKSE